MRWGFRGVVGWGKKGKGLVGLGEEKGGGFFKVDLGGCGGCGGEG